MQKNSGLHSLLMVAVVYDLVQRLFYHEQTDHVFKKLIYLNNNDIIYDIGSGNSTILNELGNSTYYGFDISQEYISKAKKSFYDRPNAYFYCSEFNEELGKKLPKADLVMMKGVLHHMGDDEIINLVSVIS